MSKPKNKTRWLISQEALEDWLNSLAGMRTLIAPRNVGGVQLYRPVANSQEVAWNEQTPPHKGGGGRSAPTGRPVLSVKEVFFPPTERLLTIEKSGGRIHLNETLPEGQQIIFGVRPCEARGVKILDALFLDTHPVDPYYARRRENTVLVGLACREMGPTCFCTSTGGSPEDAGDVDIMLYADGNDYLVEAVTEKGRFLVPGGEWKTTEAKNPQQTAGSQFAVPKNGFWPTHFNDEYWARLSERCLSCRACAYVCPTCRCFAVRDEVTDKPNTFERIRCWDACAGENYRRIAGGHKPRAEKGERLRNRFFCKFYYYPEQYGLGETSACTGCGRCIDVCPVNVDITEVLTDLGRPA